MHYIQLLLLCAIVIFSFLSPFRAECTGILCNCCCLPALFSSWVFVYTHILFTWFICNFQSPFHLSSRCWCGVRYTTSPHLFAGDAEAAFIRVRNEVMHPVRTNTATLHEHGFRWKTLILLLTSLAGEGTSLWLWLLRLWTFGSRPCRSSSWVWTKGTHEITALLVASSFEKHSSFTVLQIWNYLSTCDCLCFCMTAIRLSSFSSSSGGSRGCNHQLEWGKTSLATWNGYVVCYCLDM